MTEADISVLEAHFYTGWEEKLKKYKTLFSTSDSNKWIITNENFDNVIEELELDSFIT